MGSQPGRRAIDWNTAQRVGELLAGSPSPGGPPTKAPCELVHDFARRVGEYTGLELPEELPALEMVDRPAWIAANLLTMRPVLDQAIERLVGEDEDGDVDGNGKGHWSERAPGILSGPLRASWSTASGSLRAASGHLLGAQLGAVTGILSQRVLGQYDVSLIGPPVAPRLLLLEPNLVAAAHNLGVDQGELTAWVAIHEITHAVQFAGAPWLRGHLGGLLEELLAGLQLASENDLGALLGRARKGDLDLGKLIERARQGELLRLGLGEERWELIEQMQAVMSLIEGHAEHTMDAVGAGVLPSLPELRAALSRRRASKGLPWRVLERLLGLELKMKQYEVGRRFCDAVVKEGGPQALMTAWRSPEDLPSAAELNEPGLWLTRVLLAA